MLNVVHKKNSSVTIFVKITSSKPTITAFEFWRKEDKSDKLMSVSRHPATDEIRQAITDVTGRKNFDIKFVKP